MLSIDSNDPNVIIHSISSTDDSVESNIVLAPEDVATLTTLMHRYDELLLEMDKLSNQLETLLESEGAANKQPNPA